MRIKHLIISMAFISCVMLVISCAGGKKSMTIERGQVPPEFPGYTGVLLVKSGSNPWERHVNRYSASEYKGPLEIVAPRLFSTAPYDDLKKYRFVMELETHYTQSSGTHGGSIIMTDRQTGKTYRTKSGSGYFKTLKNYLNVLGAYRTQSAR